MKITFVIQGPLTCETIKTAKICKKYGEVIVSCWDNDCPNLIKNLGRHAKIIKNKFFKPKGYNFQNIQYHIKTFFEGVRAAKTDYVIKLRSDEYFTDISNLVDTARKNPNKITTCNFLFRPDVLFHPSDHIIGGKKKSLFSMLIWSMEFIKNFKEDKPVSAKRVGLKSELFYKDITAELTFCISYLKSKGINVVEDIKGMDDKELKKYHKKIMNDHYALVRASDMGNFLFRFKGNPDITGPTAFTSEEQFLNYNLKSIKSLKEL
tara:strand:+ start:3414 stop:4205 length:792 start_codon:yes stop_codon:yes gene_type:complete